MEELKQALKKQVDEHLQSKKREIICLSQAIHENPELGHKEYYACQILTDYLGEHDFSIKRKLAGLDTAFKASYGRGIFPKIALLAEYDALPGIGHGCGHNLIGAASVGAGVVVKEVLAANSDIKGQVVVYGTPAEETSGGKVTLVDKGCFNGINAALMFHPSDNNTIENTSLAMDAIEFTFTGRSAHAASAPFLAVNALDGVIHFYNGINALRQYLEEDVRIHGIIAEGGKTPNIIPDKAVTRWYIRASTRERVNELVKKVQQCAKGAASMVGAKVTWRNYELSYDEMVTNKALADIFRKNLKAAGVINISSASKGRGSIDMGNVSQKVPSIHPYLAMGLSGGCGAHTEEFAKAAGAAPGHQVLILAARVLAYTVIDLLVDKVMLDQVKKEFELRI